MLKTFSRYYISCLIILLPFLQASFVAYPIHDIWILSLLGITQILCIGLIISKQEFTFSIGDFVIGIFISGLVLSTCINKGDGFGVITFLTGILYALIYLVARLENLSRSLNIAILISAILQAIIAYGQLLGWITNVFYGYSVTGSFSNPAPLGCLLCLGLIVTLYEILQNPKRWVYFICFVFLLCCISLTNSRAAWLSAIIGCSYLLSTYHSRNDSSNKKIQRIIGGGILFLILVGLLYVIRKDSANGRLLIWRISANLILEKPCLGHGPGSFQSLYPYKQAEYFNANPDSSFAYLADDISCPFNEWLSILVQLGLWGFCTFLTLIILSFQNKKTRLNQSVLLGLCIFGFFLTLFYILLLLLY